jgi:hypothetical protein
VRWVLVEVKGHFSAGRDSMAGLLLAEAMLFCLMPGPRPRCIL